MEINVTTGIGSGPTTLAAFDAALNDAGVANYNIITLSSVIPPNSEIKVHDRQIAQLPGEWGDRLYVVMAEKRDDTPNAEVWAGIGWVQDEKTKKGLFVEHHGSSEDSVRRDIKQSLEALMATRNVDFGPIHMKVAGSVCKHLPVCALVIAVYEPSSWQTVANPEIGK